MHHRADTDVVVVGAGIVGLATARAIVRDRPSVSVTVIDKEHTVGAHQSSRNSGVIHAGVYYAPSSDKAALCRRGRDALLSFCESHGIAHEICGKVVVATSASELERLDALHARCRANGIAVTLLDRRGLAEVEPHADGLAALHVHPTGIVDFLDVCGALADELRAAGATVRTGCPALAIRERAESVEVDTPELTLRARRLVNCAGLHSDRIARLAGCEPDAVVLPVRGEYYTLRPERRHLVRNLIYPVPDPRLPFLGVHLTRSLDGRVHVGPNAVIAFGREAYGRFDVDLRDVRDMLRTPATRGLGRRLWRTEAAELARSISRRRFAAAVARLVPDVCPDDLVRAGSGIRAQAIARDGSLLDDFAFRQSGRCLHVVNAPSPAATAALAIGEEIARRIR